MTALMIAAAIGFLLGAIFSGGDFFTGGILGAMLITIIILGLNLFASVAIPKETVIEERRIASVVNNKDGKFVLAHSAGEKPRYLFLEEDEDGGFQARSAREDRVRIYEDAENKPYVRYTYRLTRGPEWLFFIREMERRSPQVEFHFLPNSLVEERGV